MATSITPPAHHHPAVKVLINVPSWIDPGVCVLLRDARPGIKAKSIQASPDPKRPRSPLSANGARHAMQCREMGVLNSHSCKIHTPVSNSNNDCLAFVESKNICWLQVGCSLATAKCNDYVRQDAGELKNDSLKLRTTCKTFR